MVSSTAWTAARTLPSAPPSRRQDARATATRTGFPTAWTSAPTRRRAHRWIPPAVPPTPIATASRTASIAARPRLRERRWTRSAARETADNDKVPDGLDQCPNTADGRDGEQLRLPGCRRASRPRPRGGARPAPGRPRSAAGARGPGSFPARRLPRRAPPSALQRGPYWTRWRRHSGPTRGSWWRSSGTPTTPSSQSANIQLSAARADAVRNYLLRNGVRPEQLQARGAGETGAPAGGGPAQSSAENRRTEIRIVTPQP